MNYKKSIIGSSIAFIIATSCYWLSAILIAIGGGSAVMRIANGLEKAGKTSVKAYACHPGSSRTSLISTSVSLMMRAIFGLMKLTPLTQSAEKGAHPQLMCATEAELDQKAFYGAIGLVPSALTKSRHMSKTTKSLRSCGICQKNLLV